MPEDALLEEIHQLAGRSFCPNSLYQALETCLLIQEVGEKRYV